MMQAILEPCEFAYVLRALSATRIVGADSSRLFPTDPAENEQLMAQGLSQLKAHGWLVPAEPAGAFNLNNQLAMMCAAVADPEQTLMVTRVAEDDRQQHLTYYCAHGVNGLLIVEQYFSAEQSYILTPLTSLDDVILRLQSGLRLNPQIESWAQRVEFTVEQFQAAMRRASAGDSQPLAVHLGDGATADLLHSLMQLSKLAEIEMGALIVNAPIAFDDFVLLRDEAGHAWALDRDSDANQVSLIPLDRSKFGEIIENKMATLASAWTAAVKKSA